ncbi:MAG: 30S ribosomal protein S17 [Gammaproteobacteria bacterium]
MNEATKNERKLTGVVVSNKMDKGVTVAIDRLVKHPVYGKFVRRTSKMHVHDEANECNVGDKVAIKQCRPLSKTKSWTLVEVLERSPG